MRAAVGWALGRKQGNKVGVGMRPAKVLKLAGESSTWEVIKLRRAC